ncbi:MAG: apolipoprotein N-acyltransferase [Candidatus Aureabacteria bacterium]|nr:apolipoprotein N-acyltransferase [Candidatus Auribacterota bacterium]
MAKQRFTHVFFSILLSAFLTGAALFPWNGCFLIFVSFAPLFHLFENSSVLKRMFIALFWGLIVHTSVLFWLMPVTVAGTFTLAAYHALYAVLFALLWKKMKGGIEKAFCWVGLEWLKSNLACGSPWGDLGQALADHPLFMQMASLGGIHLVSFWIIWVNLKIFDCLIKRKENKSALKEVLLLSAIFVVPLIFGFIRLNDHDSQKIDGGEAIKVAVIQPNISPLVKWDAETEEEQFAILEEWTREAAKGSPDVVVWPETALVQDPRFSPDICARIENLSADLKVRLMIGAPDSENPDGDYNSLFLTGPGFFYEQVYHKINLVPFGEFIPFESLLPKMKLLTPIQGGFLRGDQTPLFYLNKIPFSPLICFEDTLSSFVRKCVHHGARFLVSATNDGWFSIGSIGPLSHDYLARYRSVENGVPLVRCANTGVSSCIDCRGRVIKQVLGNKEEVVNIPGILTWDVPVHMENTLFSSIGSIWILLGLAWSFILAVFQKRRAGSGSAASVT